MFSQGTSPVFNCSKIVVQSTPRSARHIQRTANSQSPTECVMKIPSVVSLLAVFSLRAGFASAQGLKIGSGNTAFADPPVPRPHTQPCAVTLFKGYKFADFSPKSFEYAPPAGCPGPSAKVILAANFSVTKGRQFDRTPTSGLVRPIFTSALRPNLRTTSPETGISSAT